MSLVEYQRKRHFGKTREPPPTLPTADERAIFVVQLHHASRRHYDFRLQVGDTLKSWAVPKGPSFDPKVKRLAAEVEDHPVDYANFAGMIPEGQYGGGHVAIFDQGVWSTDGDAREQLDKGHLRFELFGDKLHGGWHLVRSRRVGRQPEWLLFKHQDQFAAENEADDLLDDVTPPPAHTVRGVSGKTASSPIAAEKLAASSRIKKARPKVDLKPESANAAKAAVSNWAKRASALTGAVKHVLRHEFFEPQLARLGDAPPKGDDWIHEVKWDGYRITATIVDGEIRLWSRNGLDWTRKLPEVVGALKRLELQSAAFDGELVALRNGHSDFGLLQATLSGASQAPLAYVIFDVVHLEGHALERVPLLQRKELLSDMLAKPPPRIAYSSHSRGNGDAAFALASELGLEGIMSKRFNSPYRGGRGDDWRKTKRLDSDEFAVVGYTLAQGTRHGFGSLLLAKPDPEHGWRYVGRVGSGFSDELLRTVSARLETEPKLKKSPAHIDAMSTELRRATWIEPTWVVEVFSRGIGNQGLLRQPSLKGIRMDKTVQQLGDSDRKQLLNPAAKAAALPKPAAQAAVMRKPAAKAVEPGAEPMRLTSPDKIVYPDRGTTKRQVADYYLAVMDWFLPEIKARPLSIIRCPDGIGKACFFQKHLTAGVKLADTVRIPEDSGKQADYLVVNDAASVMELVQFNALEFHPWGSTADNPERANRIVFDLDPGPGVEWSEVKNAAKKIHDLLERIELKSYLRTSGGKGLHVVVPLNPGCDWNLVKPFAHAFAESMSQAEPTRFVANMSKKQREGRIFLDYLRNGRGATSVASYSLRAREGAPVAVNLAWSELSRLKAPNFFDIDSVPKRLAKLKTDPWEGIDDIQQNLSKLKG